MKMWRCSDLGYVRHPLFSGPVPSELGTVCRQFRLVLGWRITGIQGAHVLTRRSLRLNGLVLLSIYMSALCQSQADGLFMVRIRTDETVRGALPPIALQNLAINPDRSDIARQMASRAPPGRAAPVILIIVGAIALVQIVEMVNEMVREFYYGGVVIDGRKTPAEITNDPKIPPNMIFVFQGDGTVQHFKSGELPTGLLESVLKAKP
jgi:hypothetical protein